MRKIILAVFVVLMFATPCLAQEIEPEGLLGIDGTLWQSVKSFGNVDYPFKITYGFVNGQVYFGDILGRCQYFSSSSYEEFIIFSLVEYYGETQPCYSEYFTSFEGKGVFFPLLRIGFISLTTKSTGLANSEQYENFAIVTLEKKLDSWVPSLSCIEYGDCGY